MTPEAWVLSCNLLDELYPAEDPAYDRALFELYRRVRSALADEMARSLVPASVIAKVIAAVDDWYVEKRRLLDGLLEQEFLSRQAARAVGRLLLGGIQPRADAPIGKNWVTNSEANSYYRRIIAIRRTGKADKDPPPAG